MEATEQPAVTSLDDLPERDDGRVVPGDHAGKKFLREAILAAHENCFDQMWGCIVVGIGTAHVYHEHVGGAMRDAVDHFPAGALSAFAVDGTGIGDATLDKPVNNWYGRQDEKYPAFEVTLVGAQRFYLWGPDAAMVSEVAPAVVNTGDFRISGVADCWPTDIGQVEVGQLAIERGTLEQRLPDGWEPCESVEGGEESDHTRVGWRIPAFGEDEEVCDDG